MAGRDGLRPLRNLQEASRPGIVAKRRALNRACGNDVVRHGSPCPFARDVRGTWGIMSERSVPAQGRLPRQQSLHLATIEAFRIQAFRALAHIQASQWSGRARSYDRKLVESLALGPARASCSSLCHRRLSRQIRLLNLLRKVRRFRSRASRLPAEAGLLRKARTVAGVVRRHHGVVGRQPPFFPVLPRGHPVPSLQVPLEQLQLLSVLQADDVVWEHRSADWHGWRQWRRCRCWFGRAGRGQRAMDGLDQLRQRSDRDLVVADMGSDDLRRQPQNVCIRFACHAGPFRREAPCHTRLRRSNWVSSSRVRPLPTST